MAQKTIHRTVVQVEILHEEPVNMGNYSMRDILYQIDEGDWSGVFSVIESNVALTGKAAVEATKAQGSDTEFFGMDEDGNEIED